MEQATTNRYEEIAEKKDLDVNAFEAFCDNQHITEDEAEDAVSDFRDAYLGEFSSEDVFAQDWVLGDVDIPDIVRHHIDWAAVFHCELRHDFYEVDGHYFRNI